jgi:hypothetical protein
MQAQVVGAYTRVPLVTPWLPSAYKVGSSYYKIGEKAYLK